MPKKPSQESDPDDPMISSSEEEHEEEKHEEHTVAGLKVPKEKSPRIFIPLNGDDPVPGVMPEGPHLTLPSCILSVGVPRTGKTNFGKYLAYQMAPFVNHGLVICPNPVAAEEYDWLPDQFLVRVYSRDLIREFMDFQEKNGNPLCFLYLDDCVGSTEFNSNEIQKLCTQYRKYKVMLYFGVQAIARIVPPVIRQCFTHVIAFKAEQERVLKILWESFFAKYFLNIKQFRNAMIQLPKYSAMFKNEDAGTLNIVRAPPPEDLPEFYLDWTAIPPKIEDEEGNSELPEQFRHLEKHKSKRLAEEAGSIEADLIKVPKPAVENQRKVKIPVDPNDKLNNVVAKIRAPESAPIERSGEARRLWPKPSPIARAANTVTPNVRTVARESPVAIVNRGLKRKNLEAPSIIGQALKRIKQ